MKAIILVAMGGSVGAVLRYGISKLADNSFGPSFPYGTLIVNILGSFLLGALLVETGRAPISPELKLVVGTGLCGSLTTFSTFSVQSLAFAERQQWGAFALNIGLNLGLGFAAAMAGIALIKALNG